MKARYWAVALLAIAVSVSFMGCGSKGGTGGQIEGVDWVLESYDSGGAMVDAPADLRIDALFEKLTVSGFSGINNYSANYTASGGKLTIGEVVTTLMAGPEDIMSVEQTYLADLQEASSYSVEGQTLSIFNKQNQKILVYVKGEAASLTGVTWLVTGYNNGKQAVVSVVAGSELSAVFSEDGKVSGSGGVNTFNGPYKAGPLSISIGPLTSTLMASGDPALMEQEQAYLAALQSASVYRIKGSDLELRREDGALAVSLTVKR